MMSYGNLFDTSECVARSALLLCKNLALITKACTTEVRNHWYSRKRKTKNKCKFIRQMCVKGRVQPSDLKWGHTWGRGIHSSRKIKVESLTACVQSGFMLNSSPLKQLQKSCLALLNKSWRNTLHYDRYCFAKIINNRCPFCCLPTVIPVSLTVSDISSYQNFILPCTNSVLDYLHNDNTGYYVFYKTRNFLAYYMYPTSVHFCFVSFYDIKIYKNIKN